MQRRAQPGLCHRRGLENCIHLRRRFLHVRWPYSFMQFLKALDQLTLEVFDIVPVECATGARTMHGRAAAFAHSSLFTRWRV